MMDKKNPHRHALVYFECVNTLLKKNKSCLQFTIVNLNILFINKNIFSFLFLYSFDISDV